jgi:hypothetical protein
MAKSKKSRVMKQDPEAEQAQSSLDQEQDQGTSLGSKAEEGDTNPDGSVTVSFSDEEDQELEGGLGDYDIKDEHYANLVDKIKDDQQLRKLGALVITNTQSDENSRSDWMRTVKFGLDLIGVKVEEKNTPFQGACSAQHPLLMESAVKFQSKASNELLPAAGPVKVSILGDCTPEKEQQANRIKAHMNFQITEEMTEFYTDSERMLLYVPLVGSGFKKTYYNSHLERPCSEFVPADQFIVPNAASDLQRADRYTHILYKTDYELEADCAAGLYTMPEDGLGIPATPKLTDVAKKVNELIGITIGIGDRDKVYTLYEHHIMLHIEGLDEFDEKEKKKYKLASPYILTVDSSSGKLIGLRRNWKKDDKKRKKKVQFTHYCFVPSFNFYGFGFLHLLGNLQLSLTASLRSLVDAGQFATLQGGFKLKGVRIVDDGSPIHPGQFKEIESSVQDINKAIMNLPFKEPSNVLFQMLEFLDQKGQQFADQTDAVVAESTNYGPVGTTMALLEASAKFFSAIHKRLHSSLRNELKMIADINAETLPDNLEYNVENATMKITREDYSATMSVVPVSDPNIPSSAHRMAKAQSLLTMAQQAPPGLYDMREINRHVLINMDYDNIDKILPLPQQAQPQDPLSDLRDAVGGKPIKAFPGQDHKAHIAIKQAFMQDPMSGQNPMMQKASVTIQANIQEHMLAQFVEQIQATVASAQGQQGGQQQQMGQPGGMGAAPQGQAPQQSQAPQDPMVQAAQQVAQINQQILKNQAQPQPQPKDQAALMLAQAEQQDTQTKAKAQQFTEVHKTAELELKKEALQIQKAQVVSQHVLEDKKQKGEIDKIVTTKGLDSMIQAMSQGHDAQTQHSLQHQKTLGAIATMPPPKPPTPTKGN